MDNILGLLYFDKFISDDGVSRKKKNEGQSMSDPEIPKVWELYKGRAFFRNLEGHGTRGPLVSLMLYSGLR